MPPLTREECSSVRSGRGPRRWTWKSVRVLKDLHLTIMKPLRDATRTCTPIYLTSDGDEEDMYNSDDLGRGIPKRSWIKDVHVSALYSSGIG